MTDAVTMMRPTANLRFVEHREPTYGSDRVRVVGSHIVKTLQQEWIGQNDAGDFVSNWVDVPTVKEGETP